MNDEALESASGNTPEGSAATDLPFPRFLRTESVWAWRAWVAFGCAMVFCTMQAVPSWSHPSLHVNWDPPIYYVIIGICGAGAGSMMARYRFPGLVAGAIAGCGSLLTAVVVLERIPPFSRYVFVLVDVAGLLPGMMVYWVWHVMLERLARRRFTTR